MAPMMHRTDVGDITTFGDEECGGSCNDGVENTSGSDSDTKKFKEVQDAEIAMEVEADAMHAEAHKLHILGRCQKTITLGVGTE